MGFWFGSSNASSAGENAAMVAMAIGLGAKCLF